jgi:hypothetical protein
MCGRRTGPRRRRLAHAAGYCRDDCASLSDFVWVAAAPLKVPSAGAAAHPAGIADGFGNVEGITHDYIRHGTTTLFAALDVANGGVLTYGMP